MKIGKKLINLLGNIKWKNFLEIEITMEEA